MGRGFSVIDMAGKKYGHLTALRPTGERSKANNRIWEFRCSCGNLRKADGYDVRNGKYTTCHTCSYFNARKACTKHGMSKSPEFRTWSEMLSRCYNPKVKNYKNYGGRGIGVCDKWRNSFEAFYQDMGNKPAGKSIDRIDNEKGYSPDNCRWATSEEQANNKRSNVFISISGKRKTLAQWGRELGLNGVSVRYRASRGLDVLNPHKKETPAVLYTFRGRNLKLSEWSKILGIPKQLLYLRISRGWTIERAFTTQWTKKRRVSISA